MTNSTLLLSLQASHYAADKKRVFDELGDAYAVQVCVAIQVFTAAPHPHSRDRLVFFQAALSDKRNYIDELHLSPLKVGFRARERFDNFSAMRLLKRSSSVTWAGCEFRVPRRRLGSFAGRDPSEEKKQMRRKKQNNARSLQLPASWRHEQPRLFCGVAFLRVVSLALSFQMIPSSLLSVSHTFCSWPIEVSAVLNLLR